MTTPRVKVKIEVDAPCSVKQSDADLSWLADKIKAIVASAFRDRIDVDVGEDLETLDFTTPKVTVTQTKKRRAKR